MNLFDEAALLFFKMPDLEMLRTRPLSTSPFLKTLESFYEALLKLVYVSARLKSPLTVIDDLLGDSLSADFGRDMLHLLSLNLLLEADLLSDGIEFSIGLKLSTNSR